MCSHQVLSAAIELLDCPHNSIPVASKEYTQVCLVISASAAECQATAATQCVWKHLVRCTRKCAGSSLWQTVYARSSIVHQHIAASGRAACVSVQLVARSMSTSIVCIDTHTMLLDKLLTAHRDKAAFSTRWNVQMAVSNVMNTSTTAQMLTLYT